MSIETENTKKYREPLEIDLPTQEEKDDFLSFLKEVIDDEDIPFYVKMVKIAGFCGKIRLNGEVVWVDGLF